MIVEAILNLILVLLQAVFGWINLPNIPAELQQSITTYLDLIFNNLQFLGFFVRPITLKIVATSAIAIYSFKELYHFTMWIYRKLPISSE